MKYLIAVFVSSVLALCCFADEATYNKYIADSVAAGYNVKQIWQFVGVETVKPEKTDEDTSGDEKKACTYYTLKNSQYIMILMKSPYKSVTGTEVSSGNADVLLSAEGYKKPVKLVIYDSSKGSVGIFEAVMVSKIVIPLEPEAVP